MRNHWKINEKRGLENYLRSAINDKTRFSHAIKEVPQVRIASGVSNVVERVLEQARQVMPKIQHSGTENGI